MSKPVFFYIALTLALLSACKPKQKVTGTQPVTPLPYIPDTAKTAAMEKARPLYRASNPRSSDILHTKLEVSFNWAAQRMNGKATLKIKPYFYATDKLYLDARGMDINNLEVFEVARVTEADRRTKNTELVEVWHKLTNSNYEYENDSLKINLGRVFSSEEYYYVVIEYVAKPNELEQKGGSAAITDDKGLYFINPAGENKFKMPQIWTQGETQSNSVWFPTIDSPNERMTQEIIITVENKYTTLSNGLLVSSVSDASGLRVDHWKLDQPHAPYLAMMAVGEFKKVTDAPWNGKEISYYVEPEYEPHAKAIFGDTREMINFYSKRLGVDYPWPKYAQVVARDFVSGAMENTSATLHGDFMVYQTERETRDTKRGEAVIAHELFHQWFGNLVTCESWSNLPLNESFAVYGEYLWYEYKHGRAAADIHHYGSRQSYLQSQNEVDLIRFHYEKRDQMFDAFSYSKGGQVLHMLRKAVGDDAFFAALKLYLEKNRFRAVEIHDLRLAFEETTGTDMNWFFNQWFLDKGRPKLFITSKIVPGMVELTVEQTQDLAKFPLYRLPLKVDIYVNGKAQRRHVEIAERIQTIRLRVDGTPQLVNFDAERQLLADISFAKSRELYMAQYSLTPLFEDRREALIALQTHIGEEAIYQLFRNAALTDPIPDLRLLALLRIQKAPVNKLPDMKELFMEVFKTDSNNINRDFALSALNEKFLQDADVIALTGTALNDESYRVASVALRSLAKRDPTLALKRAKDFEKKPAKTVIFAVGQIYGDHGADNEIPFFQYAFRYLSGFEAPGLIQQYVKTAKRCTSSTNLITVAMNLESLAHGANTFTRYSVQKGLKDLAAHWDNRLATLRTDIESARQQGKATPEMEMEVKAAGDTKEILDQTVKRVK